MSSDLITAGFPRAIPVANVHPAGPTAPTAADAASGSTAPSASTAPILPELAEPLDQRLVILLGQMDKDVAYAVERFRLPFVPIKAVTLVAQAIKAARAMGQAAIITGPRGVGKSYAIRAAIRAIVRAEERALALNPEDHPLTRVLYLERLTGRTVREVALYLLTVVVKGFRERDLGTRVLDDALVDKLIVALRKKHYRLIVVDEAETATPAAVEMLRRILAAAPTQAPDLEGQLSVDPAAQVCSAAPAPAPDDAAGAAGFAVVILGTTTVADQLTMSEDVNGRWALFTAVEGLDVRQTAEVYETVFPGFAPAITDMGRDAWINLVSSQVVRGRRVSMRQVANHCRWYFATLYEASRKAGGEAILRREETPFDQERFVYTFNSINTSTVQLPPASKAKRKHRTG